MEATLGVLGTMGDTGRRIAVLGSMLELGDYTEEGHRRAGRAAAEHADVLYAYGPSADAIARGAEEKGMTAVHAFTDQNELSKSCVRTQSRATLCCSRAAAACAWSAHSHCF